MPIQLSPLTTSDVSELRKNFEKIGREVKKLTNVTKSGNSYVTTQPTTADLDEMAEIYWLDGATMKKVEKINGVLYYTTLTAV